MKSPDRTFACLAAIALSGALIGCAAVEVNSKPGTTTTVILTRHADRDPVDGELNDKGRERAQALADAVKGMGVTAIYSPDVTRNLDTVRPLAAHAGIAITKTPSFSLMDSRSIVAEILDRHAGGVVVWVGNVSGNLQRMYHLLGGTGTGPVEYGELHILTIPDKGPVKVFKTRYGPGEDRAGVPSGNRVRAE
jgi:hypothetical protein